MRGARGSSSDAGAYSNAPAREAFFAPSSHGVPEGYRRRTRARVRFAPVACHSRMSQSGGGAGEGYWYEDAGSVSLLDREAYLAALVRLAAADGMVDEEERVIRSAAAGLGLDLHAEIAARRRAQDRCVDTSVLVGGVRDNGLRACLLRDAYRVASADGHVSPSELEELGRLAWVLGVPAPAPEGRPTPAHGPIAVGRDGDGTPFLAASRLTRAIRSAPDVSALADRARGIAALGRDLVGAGVAAGPLTRTVSVLADAVAGRALRLVEDGEDLRGLDFCWLAFGSEGRGEQTLRTDQDNGIAFRVPPGGAPEEVRARLVAFARKVNDALAACGFERCRGGIMAGNPEWCVSVEEWQERLTSWIEDPTPQAIQDAAIVFDFRPLHGNEALAEPLREVLARLAPRNPRFLARLAATAIGRRPPLGLFRDFAVDGGEHGGTIDLKCGAAAIFVDAARVYALAFGTCAPGTAERMRRAAAAAGVDPREVESWVEAFHFVQVLRLRHQLEAERTGVGSGNRVDPYALNPLERRFFREALRLAASIQRRMEKDFRSGPARS